MMTLFVKVLGWSWIALGLWWMLRPQGARKRMQKKFKKNMRRAVFLIAVAVGTVLFTSGRQLDGVASWLLPTIGVIVVVKSLILLRGKLTDRFIEWWVEQPDWVYRCAALGLCIAGVALQWLTKAPE